MHDRLLRIMLALIYALFFAIPSQAQMANPAEWGTGDQLINNGKLSRADWNVVQAQMVASQYHAQESRDGGYTASNPAQDWNIQYMGSGMTHLLQAMLEQLPTISA